MRTRFANQDLTAQAGVAKYAGVFAGRVNAIGFCAEGDRLASGWARGDGSHFVDIGHRLQATDGNLLYPTDLQVRVQGIFELCATSMGCGQGSFQRQGQRLAELDYVFQRERFDLGAAGDAQSPSGD